MNELGKASFHHSWYINEACLALAGPLWPLPITTAANGRKTFQPSSVNVTQTAAAGKVKNMFSLISKIEL
jgi:hypothetical protein